MKHKLPFWRNPRLRYGGWSTLLLCAGLIAVLLFNMLFTTLEQKYGWRVDYSFNALTTHSEKTLEVLGQLEHPVHIWALFAKGSEDALLLELLNRYTAASPLITWEQADVTLNPALLTRFRGATSEETVGNDSLVVHCEETGRWKIISWMDFISWSLDYSAGVYQPAGLTYESKLTSAIAYVAQDDIPRVMVLQGHNELPEESIAAFTELLEGNYFDVSCGTLSVLNLDECDLLCLLSPTRDLSESELAAIAAYTARGGSILFTCDFSDPAASMPHYQALMRSYGFIPKDGVVVASEEEPSSYYDQYRINLIPTMLPGEVTSDLVGETDVLLLTGTRAFETPQTSDASLIVTPVLSSGSRAYLRPLDANTTSIEQQEGDEMGPFALALEARRITQEGHVSRAFILGCSTLLTSPEIHAMTDAQEFILRMAEFLADAQPSDLNIMAKTAIRPQLSVESVWLGSVLLVSLPLAVLAAALIILIPRRRL